MCEPLSVGIHACQRSNVGPRTNVLILGSGPIGLVSLLAARAFGAPRIVIVDVDGRRLSFAKNLGADATVQVSTNIKVSLLGKNFITFLEFDQMNIRCFSLFKMSGNFHIV